MKDFNGDRAFAFLKKLSFPRLSGTPDENRACAMIVKEYKAAGIRCKLEPFKVRTFKKSKASVAVLSPFKKSFTAAVMGLAGSTPPSGIVADLVVLDSADELSLRKCRGKIVLSYKLHFSKMYEKFKKNGVKGFIRVTDSNDNIIHISMMNEFSKKHGKIPGVLMEYDNAVELVKRGASRIRLVSHNPEFWGTSKNIIVTVKGTELPNEHVVIGGHYDSVEFCPGAQDNAGGSVAVMEYARHFAANPAKRTAIFVLFASEEIGLYGSYDYVKKHKKDLLNAKLMLNMDLGGAILGVNAAEVCGNPGIEGFIGSIAKERGVAMKVVRQAYSSDNIPFNRVGVPSIALYREGGQYAHSAKDDMKFIDAKHLKLVGDVGMEFLHRTLNAVEMPYTSVIEPDDAKKVEKFIKDGLLPDIKPTAKSGK